MSLLGLYKEQVSRHELHGLMTNLPLSLSMTVFSTSKENFHMNLISLSPPGVDKNDGENDGIRAAGLS